MNTTRPGAGLLRGLAARALGQEHSLRSQRAVSADLGIGTPADLEDDAPASAANGPVTSPGPRVPAIANDSPASRRPADDLEPAVPANERRSDVRTSEPAPVSLPAGLRAVAASDSGAATSGPEVPATTPQARTRPEQSAIDAADQRPPRAIVTPAEAARGEPPPALLPEVAPVPATARRSGAPAGTPGDSFRSRPVPGTTPTEVYVSIGRVELTALPPTGNAAARPATRRDSGDGRSLADYLRGRGPHGGSRPT